MTDFTAARILVQLFFSTFFTFFLASFLLEAALAIFRVQNFRARALIRLIRLLKLPLTLILVNFAGKGIFLHFNVFSCEEALHHFLYHVVPSISTEHFSNLVAEAAYTLASFTPSMHLSILIAAIPVISLLNLLWKSVQWIHHSCSLTALKDSSSEYTGGFENHSLARDLEAKGIKVYLYHSLSETWNLERANAPGFNDRKRVNIKNMDPFAIVESRELSRSSKSKFPTGCGITKAFNIPFAAQKNCIFIPHALTGTLSKQELEAVIAHEFDHLQWGDPAIKIAAAAIGALFWWIPIKWWMNKIEREQECASDFCLKKYSIDGKTLAEAILKIAHSIKKGNARIAAVSYLVNKECNIVQRIKNLLNEDIVDKRMSRSKAAVLTVLGMGLAIFGFWVC